MLQPPEIAMLDAALARIKVVQDGDMCLPMLRPSPSPQPGT